MAFWGRKVWALSGSTNRELQLLHIAFYSTAGSNLEMLFSSELLACHRRLPALIP
jgi:hypothetical protein